MDYATLFSIMGTALLYFIYKTHRLRGTLEEARRVVIGIALGDVVVKVNHATKEIDIKWKEPK